MPPKKFLNTKKKEADTTIVLKNIQTDQLIQDFNLKQLEPTQTSNTQEEKVVSSFLPKKTYKTKKQTVELNGTDNSHQQITNKLEHANMIKEQKKFEPTIPKLSDLSSKNGPKIVCNLQTTSNLHCWWCRHKIASDVQVLGCPIKYANEIFTCEGAFCSFNCIKGFVEDINNCNVKYRESIGLILLMYSKCFHTQIAYSTISCAPHWSLLSEYGGNMSIEQFQNEFQRIQYYGPSGSLFRDITKTSKNAYTFTERTQ